MKEKTYTLKDFVLSEEKDITSLAGEFQKYIDQQSRYESKSYWVCSESGVGATMRLSDRPEKEVDAYISNDYLGMSQNEETKAAGIEAVLKYGTGACAAQAIGGYLDLHQDLEKRIARFVGQEDAILFSSGFGANAGLLRAILGKNDVAYVDSFIHTSATSGLAGTNVKNIGHNNVEYLDAVLGRPHDYRTRVVIIDGVYSQDGDLSRLPDYVEVCRKHGCLLMMDDAHGIGVMGKTGRGTAEHFGMLGQIDLITGTFSKSFGCVGGFVAASRELIQYLRYYADSNVFSAAISPQATASISKALDIMERDPTVRESLWDNVGYLRRRLTEEGFDIGKSVSPIFPIMVRDNDKVYSIADELQKRNIFVSGIVYPAVRTKEARLRVSILSTHSKTQLDHLVESLVDIRNIIPF
ncbi:MAG: aminotransferase class I/II-fold pyridoxal phosphate-dependent enzyme [Bacteroides sp.]|nr:aminotransferase class I/II-fold pyridoxal phosphate-dependent enzyme [Bacteroides sp.]